MRYVFRFGLAFALALALMAGCSDENGEGGSGGEAGSGGMAGAGGMAGTGGTGGTAGTGGIGGMAGEGGSGGIAGCIDNLCPCSEAGIRAAIAEGGGPFRFSCDVPTTVVPNSAFYISEDVILDGENNLTVQPATRITAFNIGNGTNAELHGFSITGGSWGILSGGILTVANSTVSGNSIGIASTSLTLINSTVSGNDVGMGVVDRLQVINSTVSANNGEVCYSDPFGDGCFGGGILLMNGEATVTNSTVSDNGGDTYASVYVGDAGYPGAGMTNMTLTNTLVDGDCSVVGDESSVTSGGHNIESPRNTCGFDTNLGDQVGVTAEQLNLGPLQDNGGPTMTHALGAGSVAIDQIPAEDCVDADGEPLTLDQRGFTRPVAILGAEPKCDVGALEVQQLCFQDDECSPLICCHLGSLFEVGTCQRQSVCDELRGGG